MKNLKQLLFTSLILSSVFLFISCSGDDDSNSVNMPSIFGTWKFTGYVENGEYFEVTDECENEFITVNNDNTGTIVLEDCDFGSQGIAFTWEQNSNNSYTLAALGDTRTVFLTFPSGNDTMHITVEGDPTYSDVYQRQ
jgi:hypothetical protein